MSKHIESYCLPGPAEFGQRILVIGSTCAGKTTLAKTMAKTLDFPYVELDALHWGPNWTPTPTPELRGIIQEAVSMECWVIDGNYSKLRDIIWPKVDMFIWLDYPLVVVLWRWLKRTSRRVITQEQLWNNNTETLRGAVFSDDSLLLWVLKRYHNRRQEYYTLLTGPDYSHVTRICLPNPREAKDFCELVKQRNY